MICNKISHNKFFMLKKSKIMDITYYTLLLDKFLIFPFRLPSSAVMGIWLGCLILSFYCTLIGEGIRYIFMKAHNKYYTNLSDETERYHKLSMKALHSGEKEAYLAANKMAHDSFGKSFFAKASVSMTILLPVPFALHWLSLRFENITIHTIPFTEQNVGYVFVFLILYIIWRIIFSKFRKKVA